jgi:pimeloyl-ACP methyl ester carboxylesterase
MCKPSHPAEPKKSPGPPAGDAPLLWLPGTLCDARVFAPMRARIAGRVHHDVDMTGHADVAGLARAILDQAPPRFIAVGFSLGAIAALALAAEAPDRIAGLALIAANARDVPAERHAERRALAQTTPAHLVGETLWPASVAPARLGDEDLRGTIVAMARAAPAGTLPRQTELALTRPDRRPLLPRLAMPMLVIGGAEDKVVPPEMQHEIAAACPQARLHIIPGAGHFVPLEDPAACALALAAWLGPVDPDFHVPR